MAINNANFPNPVPTNQGGTGSRTGTLASAIKGVARALTDAAVVTPDLSAGGASSGNFFTLLATAGIGATRQVGLPTGLVAGEAATIMLRYSQDAAGSRALTFAAGITLVGTIVTTTLAVNVIQMVTFDGGTSWRANVL